MAHADEWPWDLLDALDAAADMAEQLHLDLCPVYEGDACSCGVPGMVVRVRERVFAQTGARIVDGARRAQQSV